MPESTIEPPAIIIDKIRNGRATLICRWNAQEVIREDEDLGPSTTWVYDEHWLSWALPASFQADDATINMPTSEDPADVRAYAEQYISAHMGEIMSYAKATTLEL